MPHAGLRERETAQRGLLRGMKLWSAVMVLALAVVAGINLVTTARRIPPPPRAPVAIPQNVVMRHEQRFAAVRDALKTRSVSRAIGYLADLPPTELRASERSMREYFLTQFALAPWILDATAGDSQWVIANLHTARIADRMPAGFRVVEDFGDGVALLEKIGQ
jgi:hypothetical protein